MLPPQSDYDAWKNLHDTFHVAPTYLDAAAMGINAGMDQEGGFGQYVARPRPRGATFALDRVLSVIRR